MEGDTGEIYADNAATTQLSSVALEAMMPYLTMRYGNPSGFYGRARRAKQALEEARETIATALGAQPNEIYFTSGGSESDNWALRSVAERLPGGCGHMVISPIEHHAVSLTAKQLEDRACDVTRVPVDHEGLICPQALDEALRAGTALVSIMLANNEIGTVEPIRDLADTAHAQGVPFHTDAVQAVGHIPVDVRELDVDMLSLSAHKFGGPVGIGALYVRKGMDLLPFVFGGSQERGRRAGTENVAGVVGMAAALSAANDHLSSESERLTLLRNRLLDGIVARVPRSRVTGSRIHRLPGLASVVIEGVVGETLVLLLDQEGISVSSGSACSSGSLEPSQVLLNIGVPPQDARSSLRLSLGDSNTSEDVDRILERLLLVIEHLRAASSLWDGVTEGPADGFAIPYERGENPLLEVSSKRR